MGMFRFVGALLGAALLAGGAAAKPPSWDTQLPAAKRFLLLKKFADAAVLDRETGLVWQRAPLPPATWVDANQNCLLAETGGRRGWRLPAMEELQSLIDPATDLLPGGHPFSLPEGVLFWSASAHPANPGFAFVLDPGVLEDIANDKSENRGAWCVRGGAGSTFD